MNAFVFGLVDILLEEIVYDMIPFKIFCHYFYCWRGSKTAGKCGVCGRFFIDNNDIVKKIDREFVITKKSIDNLPICNLMER